MIQLGRQFVAEALQIMYAARSARSAKPPHEFSQQRHMIDMLRRSLRDSFLDARA